MTGLLTTPFGATTTAMEVIEGYCQLIRRSGIIAELQRGKTLQSGERLGIFSSEPTSFTPVISPQV